VGQVTAGWSGGFRSAWRWTALHCPFSRRHTGDPGVRSAPTAAVARCCLAFDGHRVGQVPAHLGDEEVLLVAAYVGELRGNE
jgi:hypothetical protein